MRVDLRNLRHLLLASIVAFPLGAQSPSLVKDLNTTTSTATGSSSPYSFFRFGSRIFFGAKTTATGVELFSTDGTNAGTARVADIDPGFRSSSPSGFTILNGKVLFNATEHRGQELWTTDGTSEGTRLVADINSGFASSAPGSRIVYKGKMIFAATDGLDGRELWVTDGTPAGTRFLKDLVPGTGGSNPDSFVLFNDLVYFSATDGLWKSDGTESGTVKVKSTRVYGLIVAGSRMFFIGPSSDTTNRLWVSDGTESGTHKVSGTTPGPKMASFTNLTALGNQVLFSANDEDHGLELWISDGTPNGTHLVRDIAPGTPSSLGYTISITVLGDIALFAANDATSGKELWRTDGTEAGTSLVLDLVPGVVSSGPNSFVIVGNRAFFTADVDVAGTLWRTDGTASGTQEVKSFGERFRVGSGVPEFPATAVPLLSNVDGVLYFAGANSLSGYEPWKSDGTDTGTSMFVNLVSDRAPSSDPRSLTSAEDWIYFSAWDGTVTPQGEQVRFLWRSDGTSGGTVRLREVPAASSVVYKAIGRSVFFDDDNVLWTSDGTPEGTVPATAFRNRFPAKPTITFVMRDTIFVNVATHFDHELWATSTAAGAPAVKLSDNPGFGFVEVAGRAMFGSDGGLWTSDGTPSGTYAVVEDLAANTGAGVAMGGSLYFIGQDSNGTRLWKSDGTFDGTVVLKTLTPLFSAPQLAAAGRHVFFMNGSEFWVTDGNEAGTHSLPIKPVGVFVPVGDRVVFSAVDASSGLELWASDGTVEGTRMLLDIEAGPVDSSPSELTPVAGAVYFTAFSSTYGSEVWVTDGTSEGTRLAADVEPGSARNFSLSRNYKQVGENLFFTATTTAVGIELWSLPLSATPRLSAEDLRVTEGDSGTVLARFTVTLSRPSQQAVTVDYATSDGAALSGIDYDAASGTITFAAGETVKTLEVRVRGDVAAENNEAFLVAFRNVTGATLTKSAAFAVIDDDDQLSDLLASLDFSRYDSYSVLTNVTNHGPRTATSLRIRTTETPATAATCVSCPSVSQLAPGESKRAFGRSGSGVQQYLTATLTARQRDPDPGNNSVAWTMNITLAMDALFLTPGSQANVWFAGFGNTASVSLESSDPAVLSVPPSIALTSDHRPVSFVARAVGLGSATIRVLTSTGDVNKLIVDVVPAGTTPRWPGGVKVFPETSFVPFDRPVIFRIERAATAPYSRATATGLVTFKANGTEIGRVTLPEGADLKKALVYLPDVGSQVVQIDYSGDANFKPTSISNNVSIERGAVSVLASADRIGTTARIHLQLTGSPMASPTGQISISEPGVIAPITATLVATGTGVATAEVTLPEVGPGQHTLVISYAGDTHYKAATQNVRVTEGRRRAIGR